MDGEKNVLPGCVKMCEQTTKTVGGLRFAEFLAVGGNRGSEAEDPAAERIFAIRKPKNY